MIRLKCARLVCLLVVALLFPALAQGQGFRVFIMGSGSYLLSEKFFEVAGDPFRSEYAPGGKVMLGGEYSTNKVLGIEAAYALGRNNLRVADLAESPAEEIGYGVRVQRLSGNLVLHSPVAPAGLRPYATAGLEITRFGPTSDAKARAFTEGFAGQQAVLESSNKLGFNLGGGIEWEVLPALALRLDVRNHTTGTPRFGLGEPFDAGTVLFPSPARPTTWKSPRASRFTSETESGCEGKS